MNKSILVLSFFLFSFSSNLSGNAEQVFQSKDVNNSESIGINEPEEEIKRKSFEFGLSAMQAQLIGSYTLPVLNDRLDTFLRAGFGFIAVKQIGYTGLGSIYGSIYDLGANLELGGRYYFNNIGLFKVFTGYTFPFSTNNIKAIYAGVGIGADLMVSKSWGINIGLDLGSTFESGKNGPGGLLFLRPELNVKYAF